MKQFWKFYNLKSLDGLPGLEVAYSASVSFNDWKNSGRAWGPDDEAIRYRPNEDKPGRTLSLVAGEGLGRDLSRVLVGFAAGLVVSSIISRLSKV